MSHPLISLLSGTIFGLGLSVSQMINPKKVIDFLDITGNWDPSLAFVMLGSLSVTLISFKLILKRSQPLLGSHFHVSKQTKIDSALIAGAIIFGIGWGASGYCPGSAVANLGLGNIEAFVIVCSIYAGFFCQKWITRK